MINIAVAQKCLGFPVHLLGCVHAQRHTLQHCGSCLLLQIQLAFLLVCWLMPGLKSFLLL